MPEALLVERRPHIHREGHLLRFLISRNPLLELDSAECDLFEAIDGRQSREELTAAFPGAGETLERWHDAEIVEFVPPRLGPGPHLVVVEPHMDDAALSAGGRLALETGGRRITILSATRRSNVSCYWSLGRDFFDADRVTALREAESRLAARLVGGRHVSLDRSDAPLRFQPAERWTVDNFDTLHEGLASYLAFPTLAAEVEELSEVLARELVELSPDELWIPLGAGGHVDHHMTRDACFQLFLDLPHVFGSMPVYLYEDHPYSSYFPGQVTEILRVFDELGLILEEEIADVSEVFGSKMRQVSIFASQFKASAMEPALRTAAERLGNGRLGERRFRLHGPPGRASASRLVPDWPDQRRLREELAPWIERGLETSRLVILAGAPFGRFRPAIEIFRDVFANANIQVYADRERAWDAEPGVSLSEDVEFEWVAPDPAAWRAVCDRESLESPAPTVVVRFPPWPRAEAWREQILKADHPTESLAWHQEIANRLGARPIVFCRHLGDVCHAVADLREMPC